MSDAETGISVESPALADLLGRVEKATGANFELERAIYEALRPRGGLGTFPDGTPIPEGWGGDPLPPHYTASLDAALALCERVLPGVMGTLLISYGGHERPNARLYGPDPDMRVIGNGNGSQPSLALLAAMLRALMAQSAGRQERQS